MTTFFYRCSLCYAPLASRSFGDLAAHGNVCEGVKAWWVNVHKEGNTRSQYWLERHADQSRLAMKRHRSRRAIESFKKAGVI